jgi:hypothetical protein
MHFKKCGTQFVPEPPLALGIKCKVHVPFHDNNSKKYLTLELPPAAEQRIRDVHKESSAHFSGKIINPQEGSLLKVKVPFKYNKVTCKVTGNRTIQELVLGDQVDVVIEYCGVWVVNGYSGPSWKLNTLQ